MWDGEKERREGGGVDRMWDGEKGGGGEEVERKRHGWNNEGMWWRERQNDGDRAWVTGRDRKKGGDSDGVTGIKREEVGERRR